jgi:hypothetical protein
LGLRAALTVRFPAKAATKGHSRIGTWASDFGWMNSAQELVGEAQSNFLRLLGTATLTADRDYFLLRASQEMLAAETAGHAAARAAHSQIAEHYLALAASIEAHRRRTRDTPPKHPHKRV